MKDMQAITKQGGWKNKIRIQISDENFKKKKKKTFLCMRALSA